jgi:TonB family protein
MSTISRPLSRPAAAPDPLSRYAALSLGGHAAAALLLAVAGWLGPSAPPVIDPEMVIEATLESPAAPTFATVARSATRTADAPTTQAASSAPTPTAAPPADPWTATEPTAPGAETAPQPTPTAAPSQPSALDAAWDDAEAGPTNQAAASPSVDPNSTATNVWAAGKGSEAYAKYIAQIRRILHERFARPAADPATAATIEFTIDGSGRVTGPKIARSSGDAAFDDAARLAVISTGSVPSPPEEINDGQPHRYKVDFQ